MLQEITIHDEHTILNKDDIHQQNLKFKNAIDRLNNIRAKQTNKTIAYITIFHFVLILFSSITIVISRTPSESCDHTDNIGFNVSEYLLGSAVPSLIVNVFLVVACFMIWLRICNFMPVTMTIILLLYTFFSIAWFIIGAFVLFRSNIECINKHSAKVIYAIVVWCINAIHIFYSCFHCQFKIKINNYCKIFDIRANWRYKHLLLN
jgi:hypothetical protein